MTSTTILGYVIFSGERKPVAGKDTKAENETVNVGYWENHDSIRRHDQTKAGRNKMSETKERKKQKYREWHYEQEGKQRVQVQPTRLKTIKDKSRPETGASILQRTTTHTFRVLSTVHIHTHFNNTC